MDEPALRACEALETTHRRVLAHCTSWQMCCESSDQRLHALAERHKQPVAWPTRAHWRSAASAALLLEHSAYQAPMPLLHLDKLWHGRLHAQVLWISRVDPPDHGLRHALQGLAPKPACDELCQ